MNPYAIQVKIETRANCIQAVERLEEEIRVADEFHNARMAGLKACIKANKEAIDRIDRELAN